MHHGGRFNPELLRFIGEMLLGVIVLGLALEMLAVFRAKAHELKVRSRDRALVYYVIAIVFVVVFFLWLLLGVHMPGRR